ncbi:hypothetical protein PybrP1_007956 [[Pythium] brassicae (nom. inval.)]|nr:hypothetical protein PybrP1_007956 [[Pythium] brassicae (nom. inval.)]
MDQAATRGHLEIVEWLHEHRTEGCTTDAMDNTRSVSMLQWLHDNRTEGCTERASVMAMKQGNFEKLLFLDEKNFLRFTSTQSFSSSRGGAIFQWLRTRWPKHVVSLPGRNMVDPELNEWPLFAQFEAGGGSSDRGVRPSS